MFITNHPPSNDDSLMKVIVYFDFHPEIRLRVHHRSLRLFTSSSIVNDVLQLYYINCSIISGNRIYTLEDNQRLTIPHKRC